MECPFCAETIQDRAVLCRFCRAEKIEGEWVRGAGRPRPPKGTLTLQLAGVFFIVSAFFELVGISGPVPLFGAMRGGVLAWGHHLVFLAIDVVLAFALLRRVPWGSRAVFLATAIVTADRLLFALDGSARRDAIAAMVDRDAQLLEFIGGADLYASLSALMALTTMLCWWGFALLVRRCRTYFTSEEVE